MLTLDHMLSEHYEAIAKCPFDYLIRKVAYAQVVEINNTFFEESVHPEDHTLTTHSKSTLKARCYFRRLPMIKTQYGP